MLPEVSSTTSAEKVDGSNSSQKGQGNSGALHSADCSLHFCLDQSEAAAWKYLGSLVFFPAPASVSLHLPVLT